ncbi:hypothetical protein QBC34DRAFT_414380 [Podospora aff. communis PSN243]|uniref:Tc toxin complex TcA C-terminal TcB-binding domain-containing protein n=1 Tax=Podospora aff. communis PSN243 TaxID=3040156 RepID=A0AAV9G8Q5_9PEZI|nr:hypothetical protein QBC34DRAFT_414380 [Podospora aff. communis PSN243]
MVQAYTSKAKGTCVVLSSSPYRLDSNVAHLTEFPHTYIFANDVILNFGNLEARNLHVHAGRVRPSAVLGTPCISTAGKPGTKQVVKVDDMNVALGGNASNVFLSATVFDTFGQTSEMKLRIDARGGDGGEGFSAPTLTIGGDGGNGGDGGKIDLMFNDRFQLMAAQLANLEDIPASGLSGKLADEMTAMSRCTGAPDYLAPAVTAFAAICARKPADRDVAEMKKAKEALIDALQGASSHLSQNFETLVRGGSGGPGGKGTQKTGKSGKSGATGKARKSWFNPDTIRKCGKECLFHPEQIAMTIRDAEVSYIIGSERSLQEAKDAFDLVVDKLEFLEHLKANDPIIQAYSENEIRLFIIPDARSTELASIASLSSSFAVAKYHQMRIAAGKDFFGHAHNWVPRASRDHYKEQLDTALAAFQDVEADYWAYQNRAAKQASTQDEITIATSAANISLSHATKDLQTLIADLSASEARIALLDKGLNARRNKVQDEIANISDRISKKFSISFSDIIDAATMMAFSPTKAMGAIQTASLIFGGLTKITDETGCKVEKSYLLSQLNVMKSDLSDLSEMLQVTDHTGITLDDPGCIKLLAQKDALLSLLSSYSTSIPVDTVRDLFNSYTTAVMARNTEILAYNTTLTQIYRAIEQRATANKTLGSLSTDALTTIDYELPLVASSIATAYHTDVLSILSILQRAQSSLEFFSLRPSLALQDALSIIAAAGFPCSDLHATLRRAQISLTEEYSDALENFSEGRSPFGTDAIEPVKVYLTEDQLVALLANENEKEIATQIEIPVCAKNTPWGEFACPGMSPFAGWSDVRITRARFYLKGVKTGNGLLQVNLTHMGEETIVDEDGRSHEFVHQIVGTVFQYGLENGEIGSPGDVADGEEYALPGPFATWRVSLVKGENKNLDITGCEKAWFEFGGWHRGFAI